LLTVPVRPPREPDAPLDREVAILPNVNENPARIEDLSLNCAGVSPICSVSHICRQRRFGHAGLIEHPLSAVAGGGLGDRYLGAMR
jgi:hypothetical protein